MKKVLSLILAIVLVAGLLVPAYAAEVTTVTLTPKKEGTEVTELAVGDQFTVDATLSGNTGFAAMTIGLVWNADVVTFKGFSTNFNEDDEVEELAGTILGQSVIINQSKGIVTNARTNNSTKNGLIFTANFEVIDSGTTGIGLIEDKENISCFQMKTATGVELETQIIDEPVNLTIPGQETKYVIKFGEIVNGTVAAKVGETEVTEAAVGEKVTLIPTPADGYKLSNLTVMNGAIPVEVTNNTFTMPDGNVTVSATFVEIPKGYNVTMGEDKTVDAGEKIQIPVTVGCSAAENEIAPTTYKSYELTFQYDTNMLTLVTGSSDDEAQEFTVVDDNGTVTLRRYGNEKNVGEAAVTLEFTSNKTGESDVKLTSAKIGTSTDAQDEDIPVAAIIDELTKITVTGYDVDLDEAFTGAGVADPANDYTFTAKDKNYIYTVTVTVGDETFEISDEDQDGTLIIPKEEITGNMEIKVKSEVGKTFNVTIEGTGKNAFSGAEKAQYKVGYELIPTDGYDLTGYTIKYKIGETEKDMPANYTIPGDEITGDITITVTAPSDPENPDQPANTWKVTFDGNGAADVALETNPVYVDKGQSFNFTINKANGYTYIVTSTDATGTVELTAAEDGTYTITPASDVTIKVMKWNVEVNQYVALNGKTVFLVSVAGEAGIGMQYDGNTMFIKSVKALGENGEYTGADADKYVYLVELAEGTLTVEAASRKLSIVENVNCETVALDYNVNESSNLDINDAQLVYDMYNNVYESIATVGMKKFLRADIGGDRIVNVQDAIAVVTAILTSQA